MRTLLIILMAFFGVVVSSHANAQDRHDYMRHLHRACERGDQDACRLRHLYRECDEGNQHACRKIDRERYHEHRPPPNYERDYDRRSQPNYERDYDRGR